MEKVMRIECTVKATSDVHAKRIFNLASTRLLHVSRWRGLSDCLLASSEHRDRSGVAVSRAVRPDDYINLTSESLRPFGWMQVVHVAAVETGPEAEVTLLARTVDLPFQGPGENAPTRPAMLRVFRHGLDVTAALVFEASSLTAVFDRLGVYVVQWRSLVNGILSELTPVLEDVVPESITPHSHFA